MSTDLTFHYGNWEIRALEIDGDPWVVAADVCAALGLANTSMALAALDTDGVSTAEVIDSMGRTQRARIVNEPALYQLVLRSRRPEAKEFTRWVTVDVLPAIRRTGTYSTPVAPSAGTQLDAMPSHKDALRGWADALERAERAELQTEALAPAAAAWQHLEQLPGDVSIRDAAQWLSNDPNIEMGANRLMGHLRAIRWVDAKNVPYQAHIENGRMRRKSSTYIDQLGEQQIRITPRLTAKGVQELHRQLGGQALPTLALVGGGR